MPDLAPFFESSDYCDPKDEPLSNAYFTLLLLTGFAVAVSSAIKFAELNNRLNYESRVARILSGFIMIAVGMLHKRKSGLDLDSNGKLFAIGPHRTSADAFALAKELVGAPPQFLATDIFNVIPGVSFFLDIFKTIPVKANGVKDKGRSANSEALERAQTALSNGGCVALFPQGCFARLGQEPPKIYTGAAKLALMQNVPIHVIRLDGFWSLQNPLIPLFIRNNTFYRAFFSLFHMNNIRTKLCCVIDFHLKPENQGLAEEEKIREICAQLYAYYRDPGELTEKQITEIDKQISNKTHLLLWRNKERKEDLLKQIVALDKESRQLQENPTPESRLVTATTASSC